MALAISVSVVFGWQLNASVSARTATKRVCLSSSGKVSKKTKCSSTDTEIATGKVRTKAATSKKVARGATKLAAGSVAAAGLPSGIVLGAQSDLISSVGASLRSYTTAITFPTTWTGKVETSCSSSEVATGAFITVYLDGKRLPSSSPTTSWIFDGAMIARRYSDRKFDVYNLWFREVANHAVVSDFVWTSSVGFSEVTNIAAIPSGLVVYLTQVCAPLVSLEPVG